MNKTQRSALRRFRRVHEFLSGSPSETLAQEAGEALKALNDVIQKLSDGGEEQDASGRMSRRETARLRGLRDATYTHHMLKISRIARRAYGVPGLPEAFILPRRTADSEALLNAARGMAQAAAAQPEPLIKMGLKPDFLEKFRAAIEALSAARKGRDETHKRRVVASETVAELVRQGVASVDVLDVIVSPLLEESPGLLASWKRVKRPIDVGGAPSGGAEEVPAPIVKIA